jgi:hypothetical protein
MSISKSRPEKVNAETVDVSASAGADIHILLWGKSKMGWPKAIRVRIKINLWYGSGVEPSDTKHFTKLCAAKSCTPSSTIRSESIVEHDIHFFDAIQCGGTLKEEENTT